MNKWYESAENSSDIVLSSRIRLARNLAKYPFCGRLTPEQAGKLDTEVRQALEKINLGENRFDFIRMEQLSRSEGLAMVEHHVISPDFLEKDPGRMVALSKDSSISVMINEEDHIRIQVLASGLNLEQALETANRIDDVLDESLEYAFDDQLGFLTACPSNLGTGLRASVMVHVPALEQAGALNKLAGTISKLGLTIRGTYGEGSKAQGALYQISNQITLGISEEQAIKNLRSIVLQVVEKEKEARKALISSEQFVDRIYRCYGTLKYARMVSSEEFYELISYVRIGISERVLPAEILDKIKLEDLNALLFRVGSATICKAAGSELAPEQRDAIRAKMIQEVL